MQLVQRGTEQALSKLWRVASLILLLLLPVSASAENTHVCFDVVQARITLLDLKLAVEHVCDERRHHEHVGMHLVGCANGKPAIEFFEKLIEDLECVCKEKVSPFDDGVECPDSRRR
jgi:hypothetical protein